MRDTGASLRLKKQMLVTRAAIERAEMVHAVHASTEAAGALRRRIPAIALARGLPLGLVWLQRARWLKPLLPLIVASARRPLLRYAVLGIASACLVWKGRRWVAGLSAMAVPVKSGDQNADQQYRA